MPIREGVIYDIHFGFGYCRLARLIYIMMIMIIYNNCVLLFSNVYTMPSIDSHLNIDLKSAATYHIYYFISFHNIILDLLMQSTLAIAGWLD